MNLKSLKVLGNKQLEELAEIFKALGEPNRLKIVMYLLEGERYVTELVKLTGSTQPVVSHHLKILCDAGVIESIRKGRHKYFSITGDWVKELLRCVIKVRFGEIY